MEDTMKHILSTTGTAEAEALVMLTSIMVTVSRPGEDTVTVMRRVYDRGTNMHRIVEVNEISRRYCAGELTAEETMERLKSVRGKTVQHMDVQSGHRHGAGRVCPALWRRTCGVYLRRSRRRDPGGPDDHRETDPAGWICP